MTQADSNPPADYHRPSAAAIAAMDEDLRAQDVLRAALENIIKEARQAYPGITPETALLWVEYRPGKLCIAVQPIDNPTAKPFYVNANAPRFSPRQIDALCVARAPHSEY